MLSLNNIYKAFARNNETVMAVKPLNLSIERGKCYALVGESGSGKTTLCRMISGLLPPDGGTICFDGQNVYQMKDMRQYYKKVQFVMQNAKSSLDPVKKVKQIIAEPLYHLDKMKKPEAFKRVEEILQIVGLSVDLLNRKPAELSGGQQKRVSIARALASTPEMLIFDEAISGLDLSARNIMLYFLKDLQGKLNSSYFFITHDIVAALFIADEILVMKDGEIVERRSKPDFGAFKHEYSLKLLAASGI